MLLALDVGNTHVVVGLMEGREVRRSFQASPRGGTTPWAITPWHWSQLLELGGGGQAGGGTRSSSFLGGAAGDPGPAGCGTAADRKGAAGGGRKRPLPRTGAYQAAGRRWARTLLTAAVGALDLYQPPLLLVDMGTATTVTVLDEQGAFRGGAILPGANLALSSLAGGTALLPDIPLAVPDRAIGDDTRRVCRAAACWARRCCWTD